MTDFLRIEHLFHEAGALPREQRVAFLLANEPNAAIREEVERLLTNDICDDNPLASTLRGVFASSVPIPQQIAQYRILEELGVGGMASVYLAERDIDGRAQRVALKLMSGASTAALRRKAVRERALLAGLNHPNIAGFIDGGETDEGVPFLVMEHVEGLSLPHYLAQQRPSLRERLLLFQNICSAIEHAHQRLILHLDLKPSNLLIRQDGSIALIDFGIGRELEDDNDQPLTTAYTPIYAAPEQRSGGYPTTATDVYGAGVLLLEILTDSELSKRYRNKQASSVVEVLSDKRLRASIGLDLCRAVACATEERPSDRYPSIAAFRADIEHFLAGRMLSVSRQAWWVRSTKFCRRNVVPLASASVLLLLAVSFTFQVAKERGRALAAEKNALVAQDMQASVLLALSPPGNPQAQAKIKELLQSEITHSNEETNQDRYDSTWRSVKSVITVAEIYALVGDPEPAIKTSNVALQMIGNMSRNELSANPALQARALSARAVSLNELERFDEAKPVFQRMLRVRQSRVSHDHAGMVRALFEYATAASAWNEHKLAEQLLQQAQVIADRDPGISTEDRIVLASRWLNVATNNENVAISSDRRLTSLHSLASAKLTSDSSIWIDVWMTISTFHYRHGHYDDALEYIDRGLQRSRVVFGERSTTTANALSFRASLLNDLSRHREALEGFDAVRAIQYSISPNKTALLAKIDGQRGGTLLQMGEYEKSAEASEAALRGLPQTNSIYRRWRAIAFSNLAQAKNQLGRNAEAAAAADQMMAGLDSMPLSALDRAMAPMSLTKIWLDARRFDRVKSALDNAETAFQKLLPEGHQMFAILSQRRGDLAEAQSDLVQADRYYTAALTLLDRSQDDPVLRRDLIVSQVQIAYHLDDHVRAESLAATALAIAHAQTPPDAAFLRETDKALKEARVSE